MIVVTVYLRASREPKALQILRDSPSNSEGQALQNLNPKRIVKEEDLKKESAESSPSALISAEVWNATYKNVQTPDPSLGVRFYIAGISKAISRYLPLVKPQKSVKRSM